MSEPENRYKEDYSFVSHYLDNCEAKLGFVGFVTGVISLALMLFLLACLLLTFWFITIPVVVLFGIFMGVKTWHQRQQ